MKQFGESKILVPWDDFFKMALEAVRQYNARPHEGLPRYRDPLTGTYRHMGPDEAWEAHQDHGFEPIFPEAHEVNDLFRPYEIRTVRRCQIKWNQNEYYNLALENFHEKKVIVGYDTHDGERLWVREIETRHGEKKPGSLICIAEFAGNKERYVSRSFEQKAKEQRAAAQKRRLEEKLRLVDQELDPAILLTPPREAPFNPVVFDAEPVRLAPKASAKKTKGPKKFSTDLELARHALETDQPLAPGRCPSNNE